MTAYVDAQVQHSEVAVVAVIQIHVGVDLVVIGHHVDAVAFLVGDQRIERDVVACFFGTQGIIGQIGRASCRERV